MNIWRPAPIIKVKSLGLHWRSGCLLAMEVLGDDGEIKGVRPLGGSVEFGETWQDALIREFHEELGIEVTISGKPLIMENMDKIIFSEDNGEACTARWFDLSELENKGIALYPSELQNCLLTSDHSVS